MNYTDARRAANARYDEKTYKKILFSLRKEEDADIIESLQQAKRKGVSNREWLRELFDRI